MPYSGEATEPDDPHTPVLTSTWVRDRESFAGLLRPPIMPCRNRAELPTASSTHIGRGWQMRSRKACFLQENKIHLQLCSGTKSLAGRAQWIFLVTGCMVSPQSTGSRLPENGILSAWLSASGLCGHSLPCLCPGLDPGRLIFCGKSGGCTVRGTVPVWGRQGLRPIQKKIRCEAGTCGALQACLTACLFLAEETWAAFR